MIVKLLTKRHLEFLSLKGGCRGLSESSLVKMSNCWKSHALAQIVFVYFFRNCIGQNFAMHEMKTVLARILRR